MIEAQLDDPDDLGHLQAAWALAKCVCEEGAAVVIDVYAARAHLGSEVAALAPDRAFDVMHEVTLFFEELGDGTLAAWSLGLRKFGRPDLVAARRRARRRDRGGAAAARSGADPRGRRADRAGRHRRDAGGPDAGRGAVRAGADAGGRRRRPRAPAAVGRAPRRARSSRQSSRRGGPQVAASRRAAVAA